ncbi:hypothetical protein [Desulfopila inferna]|nr:hypothetical protein [Desulfopila inferna]
MKTYNLPLSANRDCVKKICCSTLVNEGIAAHAEKAHFVREKK